MIREQLRRGDIVVYRETDRDGHARALLDRDAPTFFAGHRENRVHYKRVVAIVADALTADAMIRKLDEEAALNRANQRAERVRHEQAMTAIIKGERS